MLEGFKKVVDGLAEIVEPLNPLVTDMTPKNQEIAAGLLASGFTVAEIEDFVDVSTSQLGDFLKVEAEVLKRTTKAI